MTVTKKSKTALILSIASAVVSVLTVIGLAIGIGNSQITTEKVTTSIYVRRFCP